jgi:hypothetical protein
MTWSLKEKEYFHPQKLTNLMVPSYGILLIIFIKEHFFDIKFLRKRFKYRRSPFNQ